MFITAKLALKKSGEAGKEEDRPLNSVVRALKNRKRGLVFPKHDAESIQI